MSGGVVGLQADCLAKLGDGFVRPAPIAQGNPQADVCPVVVGLEADRLAKLGNGVVQTTLMIAAPGRG